MVLELVERKPPESLSQPPVVEPTAPESPVPAETAATPSPAVWDQSNQLGPRPQFAASDPLGSFLSAISKRDLTEAQAVLDSLAQSKPPLDPVALQQAQSLHFLLQRFWQAVDEGRQSLTQGQVITYRQVPVTVVSLTPRDVLLEAADGQRRPFDTRRAQIDRDLAIALVERRLADALPAAWRMMGGFLAVDHNGDVSRAREYLQQAEQHGFPSQVVLEVVERKPPESLSQPPVIQPLDAATPNPSGTMPLRSIPARAAQDVVRRAILSQLRDELNAPATATEVARLLLQKAASVQGDSVAYYVTLREALAKATTGRDLVTALNAIDAFAQSYQVDAWNAHCMLLQTLSSKVVDDEDRRDLIATAARLAGQAVAQREYDAAGRLMDLALTMVQPAANAPLQERLQRVRDQIAQTGKLNGGIQAAPGTSDQATQIQHQLEEITDLLGKQPASPVNGQPSRSTVPESS